MLVFSPDLVVFLILDAIMLHDALTAERVAMFNLFRVWFNLAVAPLIQDADLRDEAMEVAKQLDPFGDRRKYWELLPNFERLFASGGAT